MSVQIEHLSKVYGSQKAVDDLSFEVKKGEILGFLGPNGAGKSTTMKMITGYLSPTEGRVQVCGFDPRVQSLEVQQRVGYLPEHNPLYPEMYVREYLRFVARIHRIPQARERVREMIAWTGLEREQHKPIGALSKGYRQRVGLAQALLNDPEVLVLDEPVSGLDPNQLEEIRELIKQLGAEKTVILSTHIMQEVQILCDRVVIINRGRMVANDSIEVLQREFRGQSNVRLLLADEMAEETLRNISGVKALRRLGPTEYELSSDRDTDLRPAIFQTVVEQGGVLLEMQQSSRTVEAVFQELTREKQKGT